ncbi:hAD hydrolase family IA variant 3 [Butyrivibrio sp. CAG:318]|jgi:HAD superfamily hydrolase (TIGR01509 family)|nr:hAD hydrolase family IA variant 3 [Butyrivibrio sp. CAG:318]
MNRNILYKAVVFDMDGVIFDSERAVMQCWEEVASRHNIPNIEKAILACTGTTMVRTREIMLNLYGADFPYDEYARESSAIFHSRYDGGRLPMKPGVKELLTFLKEHDKKIALASSTRQQVVTDELRDAGVIEYFDRIICGDMVSRSKPAPDIFLKACEELNISPSDSYAIEDSYNGIRAAHAGGLHPIMVPDLLPADEEMQSLAEIVLPSLTSVMEYLA